jgi:hypothetical protein
MASRLSLLRNSRLPLSLTRSGEDFHVSNARRRALVFVA